MPEKINKAFTGKAAIYLVLAIAGLAFAWHSIKISNYVLAVIALLFALVSADNIFCNLKDKNLIKT